MCKIERCQNSVNVLFFALTSDAHLFWLQRQTFTVYAKIPSGQKSEPGKYLDSINVVVNLGSGTNKLSYQLSVTMNVILKNTETPGYNNR